MLGKTASSPVIAIQWSTAISSIAEAREVWVVGYSFPTTDAFMKRLLTEGIKNNNDLERIVIVDLQPYEDWKARLEDLFPPIMRTTKVEFLTMKADELLGQISESQHGYWTRARLRNMSNANRQSAWTLTKYPP